MASFAYNAINASGLELSGQLNAPNVEAAREQLRARGLLANWLEEQSGGETTSRALFQRVKSRSLQVFSRQFATMIGAGLTIVTALVILEDQTDDAYLAEV